MKTVKIAGGVAIIVLLLLWVNFRNNASNTVMEIGTEVVPTNEIGIGIGDTAPELEFESAEGTTIALSSFRGKMVLVDFWASWCGPCRRANPYKVAAWHQFKDREFFNGDGFTIYSVSLDKSRDAWLIGIDEDKLQWENHVSDLMHWNSVPAAMYQIRSIPANVLIDGNGVIVARNLMGDDIAETLFSYLKE